MSKRPSLLFQLQQNLKSKLAIGESRHAAKHDGTASQKIFSYSTYRTYMNCGKRFTDYCKREFNCKTLEDCRAHADDYLQTRRDLSAWTQATERSALAKIYGVSSAEFISIAQERREDIKRSRQGISKDFSEERNADIVTFTKCTGIRRKELPNVRGSQFVMIGKTCYIKDVIGKGGKMRDVEIIGTQEQIGRIYTLCILAGNKKIFNSVPSHMPAHHYREEYATALYLKYARDLSRLPRSQIYACRKDKAGKHYDKHAMLIASHSLGHNRISVIADNYLLI